MADRKSIQEETKSSSSNTVEISVCDIMKNNTSKVIRKMEFEVPALIQIYSDLYTKYLHLFDDVFGTCYIAEKQFFDKLGFDKKALQDFDNYWSAFSQIANTQIEVSTDVQMTYVQTHSAWIESFDRTVHDMMDYYAKTLAQINALFEK